MGVTVPSTDPFDDSDFDAPSFLPATREPDDALPAARGAGGVLPLTTGQEFLEYFELVPDTVDYALAEELDLDVARRLHVAVVQADPVEVVLAVSDASDLVLLDDLRARFAPREVRFVSADPDAIDKLVGLWSARAAREAEQLAVQDLSNDTAASPTEVKEATDDNGKMAQLVSRLFDQAVTAGTSDVHFEPGEESMEVRFRVDGVLTSHARYPMSLATGIVNRLKVMARLEIAERRVPQDGRFHRVMAGRDVDCRVVTIPVAGGAEGAVVRLLDQSRGRVGLAEIGFSRHVYEGLLAALATPHGMVLVTGPTGSGKTTTLYAALGIAATEDRKVLTVEDPVEIRYPRVTQVQVNERANLTFASALRSFLRADPDVILVGEIRDRETAALASQAALTGHLVLSTLHTNEASGAPTRLANMGLEGFIVASALKAVLSQRLLRRLCKKCAEPYEPTEADLASVQWETTGLPRPSQLWRPSGAPCDECGSRGYKGRLVVAELIQVSDGIADAIAQVSPSGELERLARANGMIPIHTDALGWVGAGETTLDEAKRIGS